ncbi:MAG: hypothetical protein H0U74_18290 [Bradymonadaceae bacterium]|nr:hypothetical protein [Lujinxingiaceae bacterium]
MADGIDQNQSSPHDDSNLFMDRWESFWESFAEATVDEKFDLARDTIINEPDFDEEWAFTLFVEELGPLATQANRQGEWLDLLDLLRQEHPDVAADESTMLGAHATEMALKAGDARLDAALAYLFEQPDDSIERLFDVLPKIAYHGHTGVLEHLVVQWPIIYDSDNLFSTAWIEWADWTLMAQIAAWAQEGITRPRSLADLEGALGMVMDELDSKWANIYATEFLGPLPDSPQADAPAHTLALSFLRELVTGQGWPPFKAQLAARSMIAFLRHQTNTNKGLNPNLTIEFAQSMLNQGIFGQPYATAAFLEAITRFTPWLQEHGLLEHAQRADTIAQHFRRHLPALCKSIENRAGPDALLADNLRQMLRQLEGARDTGQDATAHGF